ncbi:hypothetical protein DENSPDRAFT_555397 [Dentipellis sp. KUC8613]|nr:hypothetical protein DENSPDRAFT_555397 [Dentipellis sp. KUC8613]
MLPQDWDQPTHPWDTLSRSCHKRSDPTLYSITHVCRRWRAAALGCPLLWRMLHCGDLEMMDTIIERSASVSLVVEWDAHLEFDESGSITFDDLSLALEHLPRFATLSLCATTDILNNCITVISESAPLQLLTYFRISSQFGWQFEPLSDALPRMPALRVFRADNCFLPWASQIFCSTSLAELHIGYVSCMPGGETQRMFEALRNLPNLEQLSLNMGHEQQGLYTNAGFPFPFRVGGFELLHPRKLRMLRFGGSLDDCARFLDHFIVPADAYVYLYAYRVRQYFESSMGTFLVYDPPLYNALARHFDRRATHASPDQQASLHCVGIRNFQGTAEGIRVDISSRYDRGYITNPISFLASHDHGAWSRMLQDNAIDPLLSLVICNKSFFGGHDVDDRTDIRMGPMILNLCKALPLSDVKTLAIDHSVQHCREEFIDWWARLSSTMSALETVVVRDLSYEFSLEGFFDQLSSGVGEESNEVDHTSFFPSLKHIDLEYIHFVDDVGREALFSLLAAKLQQRKEQGRGIETLKLSGFAENLVERLKSCVEHVTVGTYTYPPQISLSHQPGFLTVARLTQLGTRIFRAVH